MALADISSSRAEELEFDLDACGDDGGEGRGILAKMRVAKRQMSQ